MILDISKRKISRSTIRRLSLYYRALSVLAKENKKTVSSKELAKHEKLTPAQVRKDLSFFGSFGTRGLGYPVSQLKKRIARIMRANNIRAKTKKRFKVTTKQNSRTKASENMLKGNFSSERENRIWTSDITYLWTKEGWLYLAVVMDVYSRKIVGWSLGSSLSKQLVVKALIMAIVHRKPEAGIIFHSDRGSQYTSNSVRNLLKSYQMTQSMSSSGNCYDNAITESFFHTLKIELIFWKRYQNREQAKRSIFEYIEVFYNRERLHSSIGYLSPVEFEMKRRQDLIDKVA